MNTETLTCRRCGKGAPPLEKAPFRTELGERIRSQICAECWQDWLKHQTQLINHYGLDPRDPKARAFLYEQIETVLLGDGNGEEIDTSKQGSIEW
jgi:Fe-S cluster biosynthesis and repair protein YggX